VRKTSEYLTEHFSESCSPKKKIDPKILKYYQACDDELLAFHLGYENYDQITKNINNYIASNFLKLTGCVGNGKSTLEQLFPQLRYHIFSYLDLNKILWIQEDANLASSVDTEYSASRCNIW